MVNIPKIKQLESKDIPDWKIGLYVWCLECSLHVLAGDFEQELSTGSPRRGRQLFMIMPRGGLDFVRERSQNSATVFEAFRQWNAKKLSIFH